MVKTLLSWFFAAAIGCGLLFVIMIVAIFSEWIPVWFKGIVACGSLLSGAIGARASFGRLKNVSRDQPNRSNLIASLVPWMGLSCLVLLVGVCVGGSTAYSLSLHSTATPTAEFPGDTAFVFRKDDSFYAYDLEKDALLDWEVNPTNDLDRVLADSPMVRFGTLFGRSGVAYEFRFPIRFSSAARANPGKTLVVYSTTGEQDEAKRGVWARGLSNKAKPVLVTQVEGVFAWEDDADILVAQGEKLVRFHDSRMPDGRSNFKRADVVYEGQRNIEELEFSPDGTKLALLTWSYQTGGQVSVVENGQSKSIYSASSNERIRHLRWSPLGDRLGLIVDGPSGSATDVATIMVLDSTDYQTKVLMYLKDGAIVTPAGVRSFAWSADGEDIIFAGALQGMTFMANEGGGTKSRYDLFRVSSRGGTPKRLSRIPQNSSSGYGWSQLRRF